MTVALAYLPRVEVDASSETLNKKIRNAELQKIPYMLVVGPREAEQDSVSVRSKAKGDQGVMTVAEFAKKARGEAASRAGAAL